MINSFVNRIRPLAKRFLGARVRPYVNRVYFFFLAILYSGKTVYCYCCGSKYKSFLPYSTYGAKPRANAQCPGCGSLERHRLMMAFLRDRTSLFTGKHRLLHFAPEDILQRIFKKAPEIEYLSVDLFSPLAMRKMDIMNLQLASGSYDVILCNHVLAHVDNDLKAIAEMHRVLDVNGWMIITTTIDFTKPTFEMPGPLTPQEKLKIYGQVDLCRIYGFDIVDRLRSRFDVEKIDFASQFTKEEREQFGFNKETILLCKKIA